MEAKTTKKLVVHFSCRTYKDAEKSIQYELCPNCNPDARIVKEVRLEGKYSLPTNWYLVVTDCEVVDCEVVS